jgi:putative dimethyl sulfoxide reductase chaperone
MSTALESVQEGLLIGRMVVYSDLTQCFYYPARPTMDLLKGGMEAHLPFFELVDLDLKPHLDEIKQWMQSYEDDGHIWLDLQKEYTRLFINARPKVPAPPYGSLYLENKGMIWGETTLEAVKLYGEAGLKVAEDFKDIPDHFAAELEFMWYLIREEIKARGLLINNSSGIDMKKAEKMADMQPRFLRDHLGLWFERFLDKVITSTRLVFYREVSALTREFISNEMKLLQKG